MEDMFTVIKLILFQQNEPGTDQSLLLFGGTQGRLADSYDNMLQELSTEQEQLADYERILKRDSQMGDEAYKVRAQLESHKVSE